MQSAVALDAVADVDWATDSTLFVSLNDGKELILLDWNGAIRRRVSRYGRGPGETTGAVWLARLDTETFVSTDILSRRVTWWTAAGKFVREYQINLPSITGVWVVGRNIVVRTGAGPGRFAFTVLDDSGATLSRRELPAAPGSSEASCEYCAAAVSRTGVFAVAVSDTSYRLLRGTLQGDSLRPIERSDLPIAPRSAREADSAAAVWNAALVFLASRPSTTPSALNRFRYQADQQRFKKRFLPRGVMIDSDASAWLQRSVPDGDSAAVDVFDETATFTGTLRLPAGSVVRRVANGRLLATQVEETGEPVVVEYLVTPRRP